MERTIPTHLHIVAWPDPIIDRLGFPPHSPYSELVWTPILGPAAILAYRRIAGGLLHRPDGYQLDVVDLAVSLGLGTGTGTQARISRTLRRVEAFHLATFTDDATYAIRRRIPPLTGQHLSRLSPELRRVHTALLDRHHATSGARAG